MSEEKPILWAESQIVPNLLGAHIDGHLTAWIEKRPDYCDRGHYIAKIDPLLFLLDRNPIDHQDGFPRYYMRLDVAKQEMTEWLRWRLWKVRAE